jgi:2'-5' RNA ligase
MPRLFFALRPEPAERSAIASATQPVVQTLHTRQVHEADLHLTLCFLGDVPEARVATVQEVASDITAHHSRLSLTRLDCWERSRVLCLLPEQDDALRAVGELARSIDAAARGAGIAPDAKPFRPHVTVARKVPPAASRARRWPEPLAAPLPFTTDGFVLLQSAPEPDGPRYAILRSWLAARP